MAQHTKFYRRVMEIAEQRKQLAALESSRRLSAAAFMAAALKNANADRKRIETLRTQIEARADVLPNLRSFIEVMAEALGRTGRTNYPSPPTKPGRVMIVWGSAQAEIELREIAATILEAVCVATLIATRRYADDWGGVVTDIGEHERKIADLKQSIDIGYSRLPELLNIAADLEIEGADLVSQAELHRQGWIKARFKDFPGVSVGVDWPRLVVDCAVGRPVPVVIPSAEPVQTKRPSIELRRALQSMNLA